MICRKHSFDDLHAELITDLPDNLAKPFAHRTSQHLEAVLRHPNYVKPMIIFGMTSSTITKLQAEANWLEAGGFTPVNGYSN